MKTKNKVQKAITKSLAVVISFVLISITANAHHFWKTVIENSSLNQIAMAMVHNSEATTTNEPSSTSVKNGNSENLALRSEKMFNVPPCTINESIFEGTATYFVETEDALNLGKFMENTHLSKIQAIKTEQKSTIKEKAWMTNKNTREM